MEREHGFDFPEREVTDVQDRTIGRRLEDLTYLHVDLHSYCRKGGIFLSPDLAAQAELNDANALITSVLIRCLR
jgi:hypothetical protein